MKSARIRPVATAAILSLGFLLFVCIHARAQRLLTPTVTGATITDPGI